MRTLRHCFSFVFAVLLVGTQVVSRAQEAWTLERCITYAIEHNIQVKQQEAAVENSGNVHAQSKLELLPSLGAGVGYSLGWGRTADPTTNEFRQVNQQYGDASVSASILLFNGLQKINTVKKNEIDLKASIQDVEKLKNDIMLNVAAAYLQVLLSKEAGAIAGQQTESTVEQVNKTKKMVDAGKLTLSNLLDIQAQLAGEEAVLIKSENDLEIAYLSLKQLLELYDAPDFTVVAPEILPMPGTEPIGGHEKIFDEASTRLPQILGAELRVESAKKSLAVARGAYYPSLSLRFSIASSYSSSRERFVFKDGNPVVGPDGNSLVERYPFWEQFNDNRNTCLGFSLSVPIFDALRVRYNVKNAKLNVRNYELELQRTKNTLYKEIQQARADANGQLKNYHATQKNVEAMRESFRYTEKKFDVGAVTSTDYVVAKNNLFKAQSDNIQAKYSYVFKMKILDFYKGLPITL